MTDRQRVYKKVLKTLIASFAVAAKYRRLSGSTEFAERPVEAGSRGREITL